MWMVRIAVCDDDMRFTAELEEMVRREAADAGISVETEAYSDGDTLVADIEKSYRYDLIFLDIEMERVNGINAARQIRRIDRSALLIYVSGYEQYLKELFEVEPFRFLSKPVDVEKFRKYFCDACARIGETEAYYSFSFNKEIRKVAVRDVVYAHVPACCYCRALCETDRAARYPVPVCSCSSHCPCWQRLPDAQHFLDNGAA